jgi:F0F1-type ATP synthase membrane subunit a
MKERNSGFRNESSNTKRTGLFQRITAAFPASLGKSVPNAWQSLVELIYDFVLNLVNEQIGGNVKQEFFPCISVTYI